MLKEFILLGFVGFSYSASKCIVNFTPYNDYGRGYPIYLDRHQLRCQKGFAFNNFRLERNPPPIQNKIRYRYTCCRAQLPCSDSLTTNLPTLIGGGNGDTIYLDRQTINCHDNGLSSLKLDRYGENKWYYKYDCCKTNKATSTTSCYNTNTGFDSDGYNWPELERNMVYLDRHNVACRKNYFITSFKLVRNSDLDQYRYDYKCCKVKKPAVKG